jgi:hypothetical protein
MQATANSCNPLLLEIMDELKKRLPGLGFGRFDVAPILTNGEALARYFSKQLRNSVGARRLEDKGVRFVSYSRGSRFASSQFSWLESGRPWRNGVARLAEVLRHYGVPVERFEDFAVFLEPRWGYYLRDVIPRLLDYELCLPDSVAWEIFRFLPWEYCRDL